MSFKTTNELGHFDFNEAVIFEIRQSLDSLSIVLDNVKILPENSCNRDIRTMRTNQLTLTLLNGKISELVDEGYQLYDINMKPYKSVPDRMIEPDQYEEAFKELTDCTIHSIERTDQGYLVSIDTFDHTWRISADADSDTEEWNRFMNL